MATTIRVMSQASPMLATDAPSTQRMVAATSHATSQAVMVNMADVLVWPISIERGAFGGDGSGMSGGRIPFSALETLQVRSGIDLTDASIAFSSRGREFAEHMFTLLNQEAVFLHSGCGPLWWACDP